MGGQQGMMGGQQGMMGGGMQQSQFGQQGGMMGAGGMGGGMMGAGGMGMNMQQPLAPASQRYASPPPMFMAPPPSMPFQQLPPASMRYAPMQMTDGSARGTIDLARSRAAASMGQTGVESFRDDAARRMGRAPTAAELYGNMMPQSSTAQRIMEAKQRAFLTRRASPRRSSAATTAFGTCRNTSPPCPPPRHLRLRLRHLAGPSSTGSRGRCPRPRRARPSGCGGKTCRR